MNSDPTLPRRKITQLPSHLLSLLHLLLARPSRPLRLGGEPALAWPSPLMPREGVGPSASAVKPHSHSRPTLHHATPRWPAGFSWRWRALANSARCGRVYV